MVIGGDALGWRWGPWSRDSAGPAEDTADQKFVESSGVGRCHGLEVVEGAQDERFGSSESGCMALAWGRQLQLGSAAVSLALSRSGAAAAGWEGQPHDISCTIARG